MVDRGLNTVTFTVFYQESCINIYKNRKRTLWRMFVIWSWLLIQIKKCLKKGSRAIFLLWFNRHFRMRRQHHVGFFAQENKWNKNNPKFDDNLRRSLSATLHAPLWCWSWRSSSPAAVPPEAPICGTGSQTVSRCQTSPATSPGDTCQEGHHMGKGGRGKTNIRGSDE